MKTLLVWILLSMGLFSEDEKKQSILYEAVAQSYEVLPTVIYPPSGGERMPGKSILTTWSLGEELIKLELKPGFFTNLHALVLKRDASSEPFYAKGIDYIVRTPNGKVFLVFYENDKRLSDENRGMRFRIVLLQKIAKTEDLFVESAKGGGTSHDETTLRILRNLDSSIK